MNAGDAVAELVRRSCPAASGVTVSGVDRVFGGNARRAWSATAAWTEDGVARAEELILLVRDGGATHVRTDPAAEYDVLSRLPASVRAPRTWGHDPAGELLGGPAVLLSRLGGTADAVGLLRGPAERGRAVTLDLARATAELHAVDPVAVGLAPAVAPVQEQLALWRSNFEAARQEPHPVLVSLLGWLERTLPEPERAVVVHGDLRVGNVLYDDGGVIAMLDWEMAHLGDPVEDLAWIYRSLWSPERHVPLDEFVRAYEAAAGAAVDPAMTVKASSAAAISFMSSISPKPTAFCRAAGCSRSSLLFQLSTVPGRRRNRPVRSKTIGRP